MVERELVIRTFREAFECKKKDPIVLYGLGKYTKDIIRECEDFNIVAVCGNEEQICDNHFEGKPVVLLNDVHIWAEIMVIITRRLNVKEVYQRIRHAEGRVNIYSIYGELLDKYMANSLKYEQYILQLKDCAETEADKWFVDEYIGKISPKYKKRLGKLLIRNSKEFGECFVGPLVFGFLSWAFKKLEGEGDETIIWFLARDGYFVHKMYEKFALRSGYQNLPRGEYVLASRRNLSTVTIRSEKDIKDIIEDGGIRGDVKNYLRDRFEVVPNFEITEEALPERQVLQFKDTILERAAEERANYLAYLRQKDLFRNNIILFDLATQGTVVHYAKKLLLNYNINILCFQYRNYNREFDGDNPLFWLGEGNWYSKDFYFTCFFALFEIIFAPPENMFKYIDKDGKAHYDDFVGELHKQQWYNNIQDIQEGAEEFIDYLLERDNRCFKRSYSAYIIDGILGLLLPKYTEIADAVKGNLKNEDIFRETGLFDVWESYVESLY